MDSEVVYRSGPDVRIVRGGTVRIDGELVRITRRDATVIVPLRNIVSISIPHNAEDAKGGSVY